MYIHHVVCLEISDQNILKSDQNIFYQLHSSTKVHCLWRLPWSMETKQDRLVMQGKTKQVHVLMQGK